MCFMLIILVQNFIVLLMFLGILSTAVHLSSRTTAKCAHLENMHTAEVFVAQDRTRINLGCVLPMPFENTQRSSID